MHSDLNANPYHFLGRSPTGKISSNRLQNGGNMLETLGGGVAFRLSNEDPHYNLVFFFWV